MVIMAGMLPGVESARRRRVWQSSSGAAEAGTARRASLCLYAGGLGRGRDLGSWSSAAAASSKVWSGACGETAATVARAWTTTLGSDAAREAKERLDHKLRGQRQPVVLKRHQMSTRPPPAKPHDDAARGGTGRESDGHHRHHSATATPLLQREVLSSPSRPKKRGGGGRFGWCRRLAGVRCGGPPAAAEAEVEAECAVCLDELRAGDVVARMPCAHRFHWSCEVPWVQAVSRCPVCRAHVHVVA